MTNKEILKKQIIYRSMHRGTKEMDLLLGNFVKRYINQFNDSELQDLKNLINMTDETLLKWYIELNNKELIPISKVSKMFKKFKI